MSLRGLVWGVAALGLLVLVLLGCGEGPSASASGSDATSTTTSTSSESGTESETTGSETETETDTETGTDTDEPPGNPLLGDAVLNIAHRGGGRLRPEATLPAFANALEVGADVIEFDVHASSDGVIVVMHDETVDRTTDGTGAIKDMSFDELRSLDAGYRFTPDGGQTFPYRGMGIQIPSLDEVFESFPEQTYLIEIKQEEPSLVPTFLATLADHGVEDRVVVASFNQVTIDEVRAGNPALYTAFTAPEMIEFFSMGDSPDYVPPSLFVQPPWDVVDAQLIDRAHALGLKVHPWTINTELLMLDQLALGVDGIMTDDPALLDSVLEP